MKHPTSPLYNPYFFYKPITISWALQFLALEVSYSFFSDPIAAFIQPGARSNSIFIPSHTFI
jgi:hypothetical protein